MFHSNMVVIMELGLFLVFTENRKKHCVIIKRILKLVEMSAIERHD